MITIAHTTLCCQDNNYPNNYYQHQQPTYVDNSMCLGSRDQGGALPPAFGPGVPNIRYLPIQPNQFKKPLTDLISSLNPYDDEMVVPDSHVVVGDPPCFIASPKDHFFKTLLSFILRGSPVILVWGCFSG